MGNTPELPDRVKRDLEEALRQGGVDKLPGQPRRPRRSFRLGIPDPRPRSPGQLVLIGAGLLFLAAILRLPITPQLVIIGLGCIALALFTHLAQPHGYRPKLWRGRYLDIPSGRWQERLYRIVYKTPEP